MYLLEKFVNLVVVLMNIFCRSFFFSKIPDCSTHLPHLSMSARREKAHMDLPQVHDINSVTWLVSQHTLIFMKLLVDQSVNMLPSLSNSYLISHQILSKLLVDKSKYCYLYQTLSRSASQQVLIFIKLLYSFSVELSKIFAEMFQSNSQLTFLVFHIFFHCFNV